MADVIKRLKYYNGQFLQEPDFTAEQEYHLDRQRRHNRQLHTPGIAFGLAVTATVNTTSASVAPGTAIDGEGRQIVLHEQRTVGFESSHNGQWVLVVISYEQEESDEATVGDAGKTRFKEVPRVEAILETGAPSENDRIRLARLQIASGGTIAQQDMTVRTPTGARLRPQETLERLRLSRQGVPEAQWPVLSSGAAGRADLAGDLSVAGNIIVTGTVDGRDVSADGTLNDIHRSRIDNPHAVTAAQVGAIASIEGVSNAGGNIDLIGANGISIAGNDAANTITITGGSPTSIAGVANAGGNIAVNGAGGIAVAGDDNANTITITGSAPASIDGVSFPGGNIDFVGSGGISISPDNSNNKRITFSTSAAAIGALPVGEYLQRTLSIVSFGTGNVSGATSSINLAFQPRMIWASGRVYAQTANNDDSYFGGVTHGYCRVSGPGSFTQYGHGPTLRRYSQTFGSAWGIRNHFTSGLATFDFDDRFVNPRRNVLLGVSISSVTANQVVLTFTRDFRGWSEPIFYYVELYITILG